MIKQSFLWLKKQQQFIRGEGIPVGNLR